MSMTQIDPGEQTFTAKFSEPRAAWSAAFVAAQAALPKVPHNRKANAGQFSYAYADLPSILALVRPVLAAHELAVAQSVEPAPNGIAVTTRIYHSAGHVETFGPLVLPAGGNAQAAGSSISYARRYALTAALGIAADEDDDAQSVKPKPEPTTTQDNNLATDAQRKKLQASTKDWDRTERLDWASSVLDRKIETFSQLSKAEASTLIENLTSPAQDSGAGSPLPASESAPSDPCKDGKHDWPTSGNDRGFFICIACGKATKEPK